MTRRIRPPEERFWEKVPERPEEGCWEWRGTRRHAGYGGFYDGERMVYAHRFVCEVTYGPSAGRHALHACDNPGCVRPDHLRWGGRGRRIWRMLCDVADGGGRTARSRPGRNSLGARWRTSEAGGRSHGRR